MVNRWDGDHHNYNNEVENTIHTRVDSTNLVKRDKKLWAKSCKGLLLFLLGNHLTTTMINTFIDALLTIRKFHSLMEICVSWILSTSFLIGKSILIFGRFVMKKKCGLHLINWTMKQRNGGKRFKLIESGKVSIQYALGKEWKSINWFMVS